MSLKAIRAEIQRTADQIRSNTVNRVSMIVIDVVEPGAQGATPASCIGYYCDYQLAGKRRRLYFPGLDPEPLAGTLFDYVHRIERAGTVRPVPVLMPVQTTPDDALTIEQSPDGISITEYVARLYDALSAN